MKCLGKRNGGSNPAVWEILKSLGKLQEPEGQGFQGEEGGIKKDGEKEDENMNRGKGKGKRTQNTS